MKFEIMNELVKKDLSDILQVNVPSWLTVGWLNNWFHVGINPQAFNDGVQSYGPSVIILLTIGYTIFKFWLVVQHYRWDRKDRLDELADKQGYTEG